ncbi:hypothetical protein SAMN04488120_10554 [Fontimonas thermophila]|uniref:Uncharacterized protein n=1 Tax=Fontimonas thermophila TaxID=1076937 RepID=A0A1I2J0C5_9GAMM|nr:hypothetical protein [Fontimonas thermophila]SFF47458.1 hypothetical protein SAMN04488120_10554 [Fontimonas thermophila]
MNLYTQIFRGTLVAFALALPMLAQSAGKKEPLMLFGTPLKDATRAQLRQTLAKAGLGVQSEDDREPCDRYKVNGQLSEASELLVCYTRGDNRFAFATYTLPSFMDVQQVQRVIDRVSAKYGPPSEQHGTVAVGAVTAVWHMPGGTAVAVTRDWPDTTTKLILADTAATNKFSAQIEAEEKSELERQALKEGNAY